MNKDRENSEAKQQQGFSHCCRCGSFSHWGCVKDFATGSKTQKLLPTDNFDAVANSAYTQNLQQRHQCENRLSFHAEARCQNHVRSPWSVRRFDSTHCNMLYVFNLRSSSTCNTARPLFRPPPKKKENSVWFILLHFNLNCMAGDKIYFSMHLKG